MSVKKTMFSKHFTIREANQLIPLLAGQLKEIRQRQNEFLIHYPQLRDIKERRLTDAGFPNSPEYLQRSAFLSEILAKISSTGVVLKDISRGLVDFPHLSEGKEILLCWELGEEEVLYWHDIYSGYDGRQNLYLDKQ